MEYKILVNYLSEGYSLHDDTYNSIDQAVKEAIKKSNGCEFLIISVIDWRAIDENNN